MTDSPAPPRTSRPHDPTPRSAPPAAQQRPWWKDAVVYQIYPRSFADADGNGIGDLVGITSRVPYLKELGVDAVWLSPFYPSALADGGYDVDDYRGVAPQIGTLEDFDAMVAALHGVGIRVMVDIVPNHSSNRHEWFRAALAGGPDAPERALYHVLPGAGPDGAEPPNDWQSIFGGPAWERIEDRDAQGRALTGPGTGRPYQWYLHIFAVQQPDLNWEHPRVRQDFAGTLRFWADRGVDGFRIDAALGLVKDMSEPYRPFAQIPWWPLPEDGSHPLFDRDEVHEIYREWRTILEDYDPPRFAVAEAGVAASRRAAYAASVGQAFNFQMQDADFTPASYRWAVEAGLDDLERCGSTTWVLGCHDVIRVASRYSFDPQHGSRQEESQAGPGAGGGQGAAQDPCQDAAQEAGAGPHAPGTEEPGPYDPARGEAPAGVSLALARQWVVANGATPVGDAAAGRLRALAGALLVMALPGSMYVYQGDELGLPEVPDIPEDRLQDPIALRRRAVEKGRDGCRVPLPWTQAGSSRGFGPEGGTEPHLPQPPSWGSLSAQSQEGQAGSTLELYRQGLALRRQVWGASNDEPLTWLETPDHALAFARGGVQCWTAFGAPVELPAGRILLASAPIVERRGGAARRLPADATAWLLT